ncbi:MAG: hypothetical protein ACK5Y6_00685 [Pseudomonadota bacterium]
MSPYLKNLILVFVVGLILCCVMRQRRYWREIKTSRPSGTLRAGYQLAMIAIGAALGAALFYDTPEKWQLFLGVVITAALFCVKITFSPAVVAAALAISAAQLYLNDTFPLLEVWAAFVRVVSWRLPEEFRVAYATVSFVWTIITLVISSGSGASDQVGGIVEGVSV